MSRRLPAAGRTLSVALIAIVAATQSLVHAAEPEGESATPGARRLPPLPEAIASFGATVLGDWLYVGGGHTGQKHQHSLDNLSTRFARLSLKMPTRWHSLPSVPPLQSVSLVAHEASLYRIGGMTASNAPNEPNDLHSVADFARFDTSSGVWRDLSPLPQGRSSHDAAVMGDRIYVAGGWFLDGDPNDAVWHDTICIADLARDPIVWTETPAPFKRRAVAVAATNGKLFVIGGMDEFNLTSNEVDEYDLATGEWSTGPELPGFGFGASACAMGDDVFVTGKDGIVYRLSPGDTRWLKLQTQVTGRMFHRMVRGPQDELLLIGGANQTGHLTLVEALSLNAPARRAIPAEHLGFASPE